MKFLQKNLNTVIISDVFLHHYLFHMLIKNSNLFEMKIIYFHLKNKDVKIIFDLQPFLIYNQSQNIYL